MQIMLQVFSESVELSYAGVVKFKLSCTVSLLVITQLYFKPAAHPPVAGAHLVSRN